MTTSYLPAREGGVCAKKIKYQRFFLLILHFLNYSHTKSSFAKASPL